MDVNGKVAILTGGARGIGFVTVQYLLRNGAQYVGILDLQEPASECVTNNMKKLEQEFGKGRADYFKCDVMNKKHFEDIYKSITKAKTYVDILVNNAGSGCDRQVDLLIDVNIKALINCTLIAIEHMGKHKGGKGGAVVNLGSYLGLSAEPMPPVYCATKHAVVAFGRSMKEHTEVLGVRVLCICPGLTDTDMIKSADLAAGLLDFIPDECRAWDDSCKVQQPDNVAKAIVQIIKQGEPGAVWVAQNDEPPLSIPPPEHFKKVGKRVTPV